MSHLASAEWLVSRSTHSLFFFSSRRRHTRFDCDWSSDVCSSDLYRMTANLTNPAGTVVNGGGATLIGTRDGVPFLSCSYGGGPCSGDVYHGQDVIQIGRASCRERV